jgi:hypothetical protein
VQVTVVVAPTVKSVPDVGAHCRNTKSASESSDTVGRVYVIGIDAEPDVVVTVTCGAVPHVGGVVSGSNEWVPIVAPKRTWKKPSRGGTSRTPPTRRNCRWVLSRVSITAVETISGMSVTRTSNWARSESGNATYLRARLTNLDSPTASVPDRFTVTGSSKVEKMTGPPSSSNPASGSGRSVGFVISTSASKSKNAVPPKSFCSRTSVTIGTLRTGSGAPSSSRIVNVAVSKGRRVPVPGAAMVNDWSGSTIVSSTMPTWIVASVVPAVNVNLVGGIATASPVSTMP